MNRIFWAAIVAAAIWLFVLLNNYSNSDVRKHDRLMAEAARLGLDPVQTTEFLEANE